MRAVIQRVKHASVKVEDEVVGRIERGLLTLLGVASGDTSADLDWLIRKIIQLRIFEDDEGKMNRSLQDIGGQHLIVSQFTLYGDTRKGNRPSFISAARPDDAKRLYEEALALSRSHGIHTECGRFQAHMEIDLCNDGPVTLIVDSPTRFSESP